MRGPSPLEALTLQGPEDTGQTACPGTMFSRKKGGAPGEKHDVVEHAGAMGHDGEDEEEARPSGPDLQHSVHCVVYTQLCVYTHTPFNESNESSGHISHTNLKNRMGISRIEKLRKTQKSDFVTV